MGIEIERKYLLRDSSWREAVGRTTRIRQGYLCTDTGLSVRVRTRDEQAFLTVKGSRMGIARAEYEYLIPFADAVEMLAMSICMVYKRRHEVVHAGHTWEIDEFEGPDAPLIVAELELKTADERFDIPTWLGDEVSENPAHSNSALGQKPYSRW